ncbi:lipoprotein [Streptomyces sp. PTD5-9]|uniref:lipoprotein n=1 Tax=Streptomyces sp. PTD5-9 TaxID=3120150 RepID=UPI00300B304F
MTGVGTTVARDETRYAVHEAECAVRPPARRAVPAVALLAALALAGCSSTARDDAGARKAEEKTGTKAAGEAVAGTTTGGGAAAGEAVAAKGGTVGGAGSACPLPVVFDLAASWKPKAVGIDPDSEIAAALGVRGGTALVCEIDAKPAGHLGYLRVWQGEKSNRTPRQVLEAFTADGTGTGTGAGTGAGAGTGTEAGTGAGTRAGAGKITYTATTAGDLPAAEAAYTVDDEPLDEPKKERAFAVSTPDGPVVIHLGGLDAQEHQEMLPAYELARKSLRLR